MAVKVTVAGVTVALKKEEQSSVPERVGKADPRMALRQLLATHEDRVVCPEATAVNAVKQDVIKTNLGTILINIYQSTNDLYPIVLNDTILAKSKTGR